MNPPVPRPSPRSRLFTLGPAALAGIAAGCAAVSLSSHARRYCDAGADPGGILELSLMLLPLTMGFAAIAVFVAYVLDPLPVVLQLGAVLVVLTVLTLVFFSVFGTLDGYPGDLSKCGPDNVPPWWPAGLPR
ncbi:MULTISPECIES: hypothetical protein [unclassified Streptomyces]|uniref:hypothetical protein n=1 Tax=unclassified Streptomyces TaxID=2593676 RepID=UPI0004BDA0F8|nr:MULTISPECIES: hypothetical protein [unclassified Streptomyces]